jgi:hypothetical protein
MFEKKEEAPKSPSGGLRPPAPPHGPETEPEPGLPASDQALLTGPPSAESVALLLALDLESLNRHDAVAAAIGCELTERLVQGLQLRLLAVAAARKRREQGELCPSGQELTAATGVHPVTASMRTDLGCSAVGRLPRTLALLEAGKLTRRHLETVERATRDLTDEQARRVDKAVGPGPDGLNRRLAEALERVAPGTQEKKADKAKTDRDVSFWSDALEGTGGIELFGPIEQIAQIKAAIDSQARAKLPDDVRFLGNRRFDVLYDWARTVLGLPAEPGQRPATGPCDSCGRAGSTAINVNVTISLEALLKLSDAPGDLEGHPIPAAVARELALDGRWRRWVIDNHTGRVLDVGAYTYRPGPKLIRYVQARNRTCTFPHCRVPSERCDGDHVVAFHTEGGTTTPDNLGPACGTHHRCKHESEWACKLDPDGAAAWTAPSGRTYRTQPHDYADDPALSRFLTEQTRRRQAREQAAEPDPPSAYDDEPPF